MRRPQKFPSLQFLNLEERLTPSFNAQVVYDYINTQRITSGGLTTGGAIFNTWQTQGPASDAQQKIVSGYESGYAVQGLLLGGQGDPAENLLTAQNYLSWYLNNINATDAYVLQDQWYRSTGTFVRTTAPASEDAYAGVFLQTAWLYVQKGGDTSILTQSQNQAKVSGLVNLIIGTLQQPDGLTVSARGSTKKYLTNNCEVYAGLTSAARLFSTVYLDKSLASVLDSSANRMRTSIQSLFYTNSSVGYGWVKDGNGAPTATDDPTNRWSTTAIRLWPAIFGIDDPRGTRSTQQLANLNSVFTGATSWVDTYVDTQRYVWPVAGYGSNIITGTTTDGNAHNDWIYDTIFRTTTQPANPFTTGDAGWMLRVSTANNRIPVADPKTVSVNQGSSLPITLTGSDPDGTPVFYSIVSGPTSGTFVNSDTTTIYTSNPAYTYTPSQGFSGTDTITFKVSDGTFDSTFVTVTVNVIASPTTVVPPTTPPVTPPFIPGTPPVTPTPPVVPGVPPLVPIPPVPPPPPLPPLDRTMSVVSSTVTGNAVTIITSAGDVRNTFNAFDTASPQGVKSTLADFNKDGTPDFLVGTGAGVSAVVRGINGVDNSSLFRIAPYETAFTGGVFVATGDINGDGTPDIIVSPDLGGGPRVRIYDGLTLIPIADFFGIDDSTFRGGARVSTSDFDQDGKVDLVVAAGFGGGPRVTIWSGASFAPNTKPVQLANFFAFDSSLRNGVYVAAGTVVNNDAFPDLVVGAGPGGGPRVSIFGGPELLQNRRVRYADFFADSTDDRGGVTVAVKDTDATSAYTQKTVITGSGPSVGVSRMRAFTATSLASDPNNPTPDYSIEPLAGVANGVFVG